MTNFGQLCKDCRNLLILPGRGADEALSRIASFCRAVRDTIEAHHYPVHQQAFGLQPGELGGGLLLSLDLSKAFDTVCRKRLFMGLQRLGVKDSLLCLLKSIYCNTSFCVLNTKVVDGNFKTTRGIRQGCRAAPALWTAQAALILLDIADATDHDWMLDHTTTFCRRLQTFTRWFGLSSTFWACCDIWGRSLIS